MVSYKNPPPHHGSKSTHTRALAQLEPKKKPKYKNTKRGDQADENKPGGREEEEEKLQRKKKDCEKKKGVRERSLARGEEGEERRREEEGRGEGEWDRALE
jgi:hypothetical protein